VISLHAGYDRPSFGRPQRIADRLRAGSITGTVTQSAASRLRRAARRAFVRLDNPEVRHARVLVKRLRRRAPDVLYLGDSTTVFVGGADVDRRSLGEMIRGELAGRADLHVIGGGGYHTGLHAAYLHLLGAASPKPLVLHSLWIRGRYPPWIEHPVYGHRRAIALINGLDPSTPLWRIRASLPAPEPDEFEAFYRIPHRTLLGDLTVGDYVRPLKNGALAPDERLRLMYAYHHGAELAADADGIADVANLGRRLREAGCRTVAYQTPLSVETGVQVFGSEFAQLVARNWRLIDDAYREGMGGEARILETGMIFPAAEFIDPADADEHLNDEGRLRLARLIVAAVVDELEPS